MKLFYENAYLKTFSAVVTGCEKMKDGYGVTLSQTAFYPEGGGQPFDTGIINDINVIAVYEQNGNIIHFTGEPLQEGAEVDCKIDWERRFPLMQEHTGEHILSGIILKCFGFHNVGFHMGSEFVTIDIDGFLSDEQLELAEKLANQAVYDNIPVIAGFMRGEELKMLNYRSKRELRGDIRIVRIEDCDTCACCGIHCSATGEVGAVKIISSQKYKSGMRIFLLCGMRAIEDYAAKNRAARDISVLLSVKPHEIADAVRLLLEENANLERSLSIFKNRVLTHIAEKTPANSDYSCVFESDLSSDELRRLCLLVCERTGLAAVFSASSEDAATYKYALASKKHDVKQLTASLNAEFHGRGGGKKELTQGSLTGSREKIEEFLNAHFKLFF